MSNAGSALSSNLFSVPLTFPVSNLVDGIQVHKVMTVSQSKSRNVWIYSTICTGYTWSPLTRYPARPEKLSSAWYTPVGPHR
jgi:hypothetical protein